METTKKPASTPAKIDVGVAGATVRFRDKRGNEISLDPRKTYEIEHIQLVVAPSGYDGLPFNSEGYCAVFRIEALFQEVLEASNHTVVASVFNKKSIRDSKVVAKILASDIDGTKIREIGDTPFSKYIWDFIDPKLAVLSRILVKVMWGLGKATHPVMDKIWLALKLSWVTKVPLFLAILAVVVMYFF